MNPVRKVFFIRATKFALVSLFAYVIASFAAAGALISIVGTPLGPDLVGWAQLVGVFALPFVLVAKWVLFANGLDGGFVHAIAGLIVGTVAGTLIAEARSPQWIGGFAIAGLFGALAFYGARQFGRGVVQW